MSAANGTDAKQPRIRVTKTILKALFMFFSCGELGVSSSQKHSLCLSPREDKMGIFQSSEVAEGLWAERLSDTPMCQAVGQL